MAQTITIEAIYRALDGVMDPEIPVLSVNDLGMITDVQIREADVLIKMIPTFAACPAVSYIQQNIKTIVEKELGMPVVVEVDKTVHWESNRIAPGAKEKLVQFGIAPPQVHQGEISAEILLHTPCPHCDSPDTYLRSPFGSTLCRAIHFCKACGHVFEQFKPVV